MRTGKGKLKMQPRGALKCVLSLVLSCAVGEWMQASERSILVTGDILTGDAITCPLFEGYCDTQWRWLSADLTLKGSERFTGVNLSTTFFEPASGHFDYVEFETHRYDLTGKNVGAAPQYAQDASVVLFDRDANAIVIKNDGTGGSVLAPRSNDQQFLGLA